MSTLYENVSKVESARSSIMSAISAKGVDVPSGSRLSDLPSLIEKISSDSSGSSDVYVKFVCTDTDGVDTVQLVYPGVVKLAGKFAGDTSLKGLSVASNGSPNISPDANGMLKNCTALESAAFFDGMGQDLTNVNSMFQNDTALTAVSLGTGFGKSATNASNMFDSCYSLASVVLPSGFGANLKSADWMFQKCKTITSLDIPSGFGANLVNAQGMFGTCESLVSISLPSGFGSLISNAKWMFCPCQSLTSLSLPAGFGANVTNAYETFKLCSSLKSLDLVSFGVAATNMYATFDECSAMESITLPEGFGSAATDMRHLFEDCSSLCGEEIYTYGKETTPGNGVIVDGRVSNCLVLPDKMGYVAKQTAAMFKNCSSLKAVRIPYGLGKHAADISEMFSGCSSLEYIHFVGDPEDSFGSSATDASYLFAGCTNLKEIRGYPTINCAFDLSPCQGLSAESLKYIIYGLPSKSSTTRLTLGATLKEKVSAECKKLAEARNWYLYP